MSRARKTAARKARKYPFTAKPRTMADYNTAKLATTILDYYWREQGLESAMRRAWAEYAIAGTGKIFAEWDEAAGDEVTG